MTTPAPYPPLDGTQPCREEPEAFFFNGESRNNTLKIARAVETCKTCPFTRACLAFALTHDVAGIWGATTDGERLRLQRQHGITPEPLISGTPPATSQTTSGSSSMKATPSPPSPNTSTSTSRPSAPPTTPAGAAKPTTAAAID